MPTVEFEGKRHQFPDDATPEAITEAMNSLYGKGPEASWGGVAAAIPRTALGGAQVGIGGAVEAMGDLFRIPTVSEAGAGIAESGRLNIEEVKPEGELPFWKRAMLSGVSSVAQQLPTLAASVATMNPAPALAGAAALAGGTTYSETRKEGFGGARAALHAGVDATAEALLELLPTKFLLKSVAGGSGITKTVLGLYLREVPTEVLTTAVNSANAKLSIRPEMTMEEFWKDIGDTVGSVMISAPMLATVATGTGLVTRGKGELPVDPETRPTGTALPQDNAIAEASVRTERGGALDEINGPLTTPNIDEPTNIFSAEQLQTFEEMADAIDPENISEQELKDARKLLEERKKQKAAPTLSGAEAAWGPITQAPTTPVEDLAELGASRRSSANAANYINPNTGDRLDRPILFGPEGYEGLTPRQSAPKPGTYTLGQESDDRPKDYLRAVHDAYEQWRQKYMPNATLVVSNEQLFSNSAVGWYYPAAKDFHMIVPAVLRKPSRGLGQYNPNTQASAFFNATHEFGHALIQQRFFEDVGPDVSMLVREESKTGLITSLNQLPETQQGVVREYNDLKARVLNGSMTSEDFVKRWMGPSKSGNASFLKDLKVAPKAPAKMLIKALARRAAENSMITNEVSKRNLERQLNNDILSLDEYLAEQLSRHAYQRKWDAASPIGQFFKKALDGLRQFFIENKKDGVIAAGVSFQDWIDGLSKSSAMADEVKVTLDNRKRAGKPLSAKAQPKTPAKSKEAVKPKVRKVAHNVQTSTTERTRKKFLVNIKALEKAKAITPEAAKELTDLIDRQAYDEFAEKLQAIGSKQVKYELSDEDTRPVYYHWTDSAFEKFSKTRDIGFHFGSREAAHARMDSMKEGPYEPWDQPDFGNIRPTRLNVKNPLHIGEDLNMDWDAPEAMLDRLVDLKIFTNQEAAALQSQVDKYLDDTFGPDGVFGANKPLWEQGVDMYQYFGPIRAALEAKGYDGLKYSNIATDDDSIVAFRPDQIQSTFDNKASQAGSEGNDLTAEQDWKENKFASRFFKAWFGDWEISPEDSSVARVGVFENKLDGTIAVDRKEASPPLVSFISLERWQRGENVFHASTVRGTMFTEGALDETTDASMIPVVVNIRNPYIVNDQQTPAPRHSELIEQGYDGIVYPNDFEGHTAFVVFNREQVRRVDSRDPYPKSTGVKMELDYDQSTPEGLGAAKFWRGVKNFVSSPGPLWRALRRGLNITQVLQIPQLAQIYPDLPNLTYFVHTNTRYNWYRSGRQGGADRLLDKWRLFSIREQKLIDKILIERSEGKDNWFALTKDKETRQWQFQMSQKAIDELKARGVDYDTAEGKAIAEHILAVSNDLMTSINEDEKIITKLLSYRLGHDPKAHYAALQDLKSRIHEARKRPFFPRGRFGNMMMTIRRPSEDGGYEVVWREQFEDESRWQTAVKNAKAKAKPEEVVEARYLSDQEYVLMSLPKDFLDAVASELDLSSEQLEILQQIAQPVRQERILSQYDQERLGLKGYSADARRSYANFSWHHANLQAKTLHRADFNLAITGMKTLLAQAERGVDFKEIQRLTRVVRAMESGRDYIMAPGNEAQTARAIVSIGYLWLNVKTALLNLYGLVTTWSDVTTKFGLIEGSRRFARASRLAARSIKLTDLNDRRKGNYLEPKLQQGLDRALKEGVLTQSYAYHLAGMANASSFARLDLYQHAGRMVQHGVDLGMYPFRLMELATRRISFIAAMEEQLSIPDQSFDVAYENAVFQTNKLQNDYSLGSRVPFMRAGAGGLGPVIPLATIFASFAQHMAFHGFGGYELGQRRAVVAEANKAAFEGRMTEEEAKKIAGNQKLYQWGYGYTARIWLLTLLLAGYEGLPGAENLMDIIELIWRNLGNAKPFRQELRELVQTVGGDPEQWSRGLGHNVLGFDISRSIGLGRIFPGTDVASRAAEQDPEKMMGAFMLDILGPAGGFLKSALTLKQKGLVEGGQRLPGGIGNIWTAAYWTENGVRGPHGGLITLGEDGKPRELTTVEIYGKALGFNPTIVSENREKFYSSHDLQMYWQAKRKRVLVEFERADWQKDKDRKTKARELMSEYNASVPNEPEYKKLKITQQDISKYVQTSRRQRRAEEKGMPYQKRYRGLHEANRSSFEEPSEEGQ